MKTDIASLREHADQIKKDCARLESLLRAKEFIDTIGFSSPRITVEQLTGSALVGHVNAMEAIEEYIEKNFFSVATAAANSVSKEIKELKEKYGL